MCSSFLLHNKCTSLSMTKQYNKFIAFILTIAYLSMNLEKLIEIYIKTRSTYTNYNVMVFHLFLFYFVEKDDSWILLHPIYTNTDSDQSWDVGKCIQRSLLNDTESTTQVTCTNLLPFLQGYMFSCYMSYHVQNCIRNYMIILCKVCRRRIK